MRMLIGVWLAAFAVRASAQTSRGQPKTPYAIGDFAKLRWLEGSWSGTTDGSARDFSERCRLVNDTTMEITFYADSAFAHETVSGRVYLSVGRIFHTMGPDRWGATNVDDNGAYFVPQTNTQSSLMWKRVSNDEWTATLRSGFLGREHVTVYRMRRARPR